MAADSTQPNTTLLQPPPCLSNEQTTQIHEQVPLLLQLLRLQTGPELHHLLNLGDHGGLLATSELLQLGQVQSNLYGQAHSAEDI